MHNSTQKISRRLPTLMPLGLINCCPLIGLSLQAVIVRNYISDQSSTVLGQAKDVQWSIEPKRKSHALVTTSQTLLFLCTLEQTMRLVGAAFWLVFRMSEYNNNPRVRTKILRTAYATSFPGFSNTRPDRREPWGRGCRLG